MQDDLYTYIDPGVIHFMAYPDTIEGDGPILQTLERIASDDFFTAVEVTWIREGETRKQARKLLDTAQLKTYYGAQPRLLTTGLDPNSFDARERREACETLKEGIDEALELGAEALAFLSGKNVDPQRRREAMGYLEEVTGELCSYAHQKDENLGIVLEVFDHDIDKKCLIGPAEVARDFAERVKATHNNFGLMVDLSHLPLLGETPREAILPIRDHLVHIHIGSAILDPDHPAYGDSHPRFGLEAGENGVKELVEFLKVLLDIGYLDGQEPKTVSFEIKPLPGETTEVVLAGAKRVLRRAWRML